MKNGTSLLSSAISANRQFPMHPFEDLQLQPLSLATAQSANKAKNGCRLFYFTIQWIVFNFY